MVAGQLIPQQHLCKQSSCSSEIIPSQIRWCFKFNFLLVCVNTFRLRSCNSTKSTRPPLPRFFHCWHCAAFSLSFRTIGDSTGYITALCPRCFGGCFLRIRVFPCIITAPLSPAVNVPLIHLCPTFVTRPNNIIFFRAELSLRLGIAFSCHVPLVSFTFDNSLSLSLSFRILTFLKNSFSLFF